ncbi:EAL domain-containing response regulator [Oxalobacteraceae bacterium R-40]|uniref:EAL domain-containing response regulator n=1 Tax=Keguizhuia sedimenti TaxID=3064264 RepID=A0ABU1BMW9_9BURK|nr:EAL domain-containing response regulator [Oxalobacteraceae bacterium R-40]
MSEIIDRTGEELGNHRVLILEDNEFDREVLATALANMGVGHIATAENGDEALDIIANDKQGYDVVLCDLKTNDTSSMDGVEFIRSVRQHRIGSLVLMSGLQEDLFASVELLAAAYVAPLAGRIRKPFDPDDLRPILLRCPRYAETLPPGSIKPFTRVWTKADLRMALKRAEFVPFFQPKVCLQTGRAVGAEMLARWMHPDLGILAPSQFIPLMERECMADELTEQLFRQSAILVRQWTEQGLNIHVAFNASPMTLQNVAIPNRWHAIANEQNLDTGMLTVEVTETAVAHNFHGLLETVTRLRMHGFGVSLDDFGTSYSSLQQLSELPITEVKIDRSFVMRAPTSSRAILIFDTIIDLARKLHLTTVAEGVETREAADFTHASGCGIGQGYFFGRPMPAMDFAAWAAERNRQWTSNKQLISQPN